MVMKGILSIATGRSTYEKLTCNCKSSACNCGLLLRRRTNKTGRNDSLCSTVSSGNKSNNRYHTKDQARKIASSLVWRQHCQQTCPTRKCTISVGRPSPRSQWTHLQLESRWHKRGNVAARASSQLHPRPAIKNGKTESPHTSLARPS